MKNPSKACCRQGLSYRNGNPTNKHLREYIEDTERQEHSFLKIKDSEKARLEQGMNTNTTVLGIGRNVISYRLEAHIDKMKIDGATITKKLLLSSIAKEFDPSGLVSPVTVIGKALFQYLCGAKCDWDDELPIEKCKIWEKLVRDSNTIKTVSASRNIYEPYLNKNVKYSLHGFGDASTKAYCTVIYLISETEDGHKHSQLVYSKDRLAPLKV